MSLSSRCAIAVHALTLLARWDAQQLNSTQIAESLESNPVAVRRVLGSLRAAGLVASTEGPHGGFRLARPPRAISLSDAYTAVETGPVLARLPHPPSASCVVGRHIQSLLEAEFSAAERALDERLGRTTIADMLAEAMRREADRQRA